MSKHGVVTIRIILVIAAALLCTQVILASAEGATPTVPELARPGTAQVQPMGKAFMESGVFTSTDGPSIYAENCLGCHMEEGKGVYTGVGMYPALANNHSVSMPDYTAFVILNGLRGMPSFEADYTDEQIATIANYVSNHFGNKSFGDIGPEQIKAVRPDTSVEYIDY